MRTRIVVAALAVSLAGCVSLVDNNIDRADTINTVSSQIECELKAAFPPVEPKPSNDDNHWTVTYTVTENVKDAQSAGINPLKWLTPAHVDKFELGVGASISNETERNAKAEFSLDLFDTGKVQCDPTAAKKNRFRFKSWANQALGKKPEEPGQLASFGYTIRVTTAGSAQLDPDFADGRGVATAALGAGREAVETVDFGFSRYSPPQGDLRVFVTNFPEGPGSPSPEFHGKPQGTKLGRFLPSGIPEENLRQNRNFIQQLQLDRIDR